MQLAVGCRIDRDKCSSDQGRPPELTADFAWMLIVLGKSVRESGTTMPQFTAMQDADLAWSRAYAAIDAACAALAAVPGAGDQYFRLCALASTFQNAGAAEIAGAHRVAAGVRSTSLSSPRS